MLNLHLHQQRLAQEACFGLLNSVPHPAIVEMIACAGYDFVILDLEHLPHNEPLLRQCIQIAQSHCCAPLVRIPQPDSKLIGRILDMGAHGIVIPQVESAAEVLAVRDAMRFPPEGKRSITGGSVTGFGLRSLADYIRQANQGLLLIPMIESPAGLAAIDDILTIAGVSMVMAGALDLALHSGVGPEPHHTEVEAQIRQLARRCQRADIAFCACPRTDEQLHYWRQAGIKIWLCGEDRGFLFRALKQRLSAVKSTAE